MHQPQRQQTAAMLKTRGIERALFAHSDSVKWLTGFAPPLQTGANPFAGGPPLVWHEDGHFWLIALDSYADLTAPLAGDSDTSVVTYPGYTIEQPITGAENLAGVLKSLLGKSAGRGQVGLESQAITAYARDVAVEALSPADFTPIDGWLEPLRMVKTDEELAQLRANFALADIGQAAACTVVRPGLREIDVWAEAQSAVNRAAGCRVPLGNDCVVGYRSPDNIGGWPLDYEIKDDSSLIVDISAIHRGYWSDSCATYYAGTPTPKQTVLHRVVEEALDYGRSLIRPGAVAGEVDQKVRAFIEKAGYRPYPHHTGHGVGVSGHEAPRLVPYSREVLQAGMVIMLEPGIYFPGETSVRLEDGYLITADGVEVLTTHDKRMK